MSWIDNNMMMKRQHEYLELLKKFDIIDDDEYELRKEQLKRHAEYLDK